MTNYIFLINIELFMSLRWVISFPLFLYFSVKFPLLFVLRTSDVSYSSFPVVGVHRFDRFVSSRRFMGLIPNPVFCHRVYRELKFDYGDLVTESGKCNNTSL